ncbi:MAG: hypothetical protein ACYSQZ_05530 [Planctomycetota bacterium]
MTNRQMTVEDYKQQKKQIEADKRYTPGLRRWALAELLNVFQEINHCLPHEMEKKNE